ncbi:MAG: hypothetical protein KatS3mg115_0946 [Candidatus Poribacteria bacterium]|nr:MAG: hypothetical protein KatS3mg115_0946 [Candidatus Poribacteria bacterium]
MKKGWRWTALVGGIATGLAALAGNGDVDVKGPQLYIWHLDEGRGEEVQEAQGKGARWPPHRRRPVGGGGRRNGDCCSPAPSETRST